MLRANQRPPSILGDDPFAHALKPPAHELDYEKHARLEREIEAKRISDRIDDEIRRDKERFKRSKQDVKVSTQYLVENPLLTGCRTASRSSCSSARLSRESPPSRSSSSSSTHRHHSTASVHPGRLLSFTTWSTQSGKYSMGSNTGAISSTKTSTKLGRIPRRRAMHRLPPFVPPSHNYGSDSPHLSPSSKFSPTG